MTFTLTRRTRAMLLFLSAAGYTAWFSGLGERTEAQGVAEPNVRAFTLPRTPLWPNVAAAILRDPFAGAPGRAAPSIGSAPPSAMTQERAGNVPAGVVVPNIGEVADADPPAMQLAVRATIVGPNPVAYVENGTVMDIVRVGDTLGDQRIVRIDLRGITFGDGSQLVLPDAYAATPPPARAVESAITLRLADLRRLLAPRQAQVAAATPAAPPPTPTPSASYPTPGPLPTVNTQGIPVGVNPTFDPTAPTPYPYPYPYAPPR